MANPIKMQKNQGKSSMAPIRCEELRTIVGSAKEFLGQSGKFPNYLSGPAHMNN